MAGGEGIAQIGNEVMEGGRHRVKNWSQGRVRLRLLQDAMLGLAMIG